MTSVATARTRWLAFGVLPAVAVVLAGPSLLLWDALRPQPWTARNLRARFQSARYEAVSLVFTYIIENRTGRAVYLAPKATQIKVRQRSDRPTVGWPFVQFPVELAPHSSQQIEVRLDLPSGRQPVGGPFAMSDVPGESGAPLNRQAPSVDPQSIERLIAKSLEDLDGFELVNQGKSLRLLLPRGW